MDINLNDKSKVRNLATWSVSFEMLNTSGDAYFKPSSVLYMSNMEIESQVQNGNKLFCGTDNLGSHSRLYIENPDFREYLGFDNKAEGKTQFILDEEKCKQMLEYKTFSVFKKHVEENVITKQEKAILMAYARKAKINDFDKIQFLSDYCDITFNNK
jgi:hypothetical protein